MTKNSFLKARNVVVFEHLMIPSEIADAIAQQMANPLDVQLRQEVRAKLEILAGRTRDKYGSAKLGKHVKLIYLFLTEGMRGLAEGRTLADEQEKAIKEAFHQFDWPKDFAQVVVIGISELRPIFAQIEARVPGIRLAEFLLKKDGRGGYDTPKIAAALIQLARRDYVRQEMFIRVDDDVQPAADGIQRLKQVHFDLVRKKENKQFCISWNYNADPTATTQNDEISGPNYARLFRHFVNSYSIRTTFMSEASLRCRYDAESARLLAVPGAALSPNRTRCRLNLLHIKYFVDLFRQGKWGSSLSDPISGAGLCFSPDSLIDLPPWTNADELITWIDDFIKYELMRVYYGETFASDYGMLSDDVHAGFEQDRNDPDELKAGDIEWSVNTYLDRLLMGCILSYCIDPSRYGGPSSGFATLLREHDYLSALRLWKTELRCALANGAGDHIRKVLQDWECSFCAKERTSSPGYFTSAPPAPCGFVPAPADSFFNSYTLEQLLAIQDGRFDLVDRVLSVLERYLQMKYQFWPHVVDSINAQRELFYGGVPTEGDACRTGAEPIGWLFTGLAALGPPEAAPAERVSEASLALIRAPKSDSQARWLMQWNARWQAMHWIGGHKEAGDPNDLACIMREIHEELFGGLSPGQLEKMHAGIADNAEYDPSASSWSDPFIASARRSAAPPHEFPEYVALSTGFKKWTRYRFKVYEVTLTPEGQVALFRNGAFCASPSELKPEGPSEWVSADDVARGWTSLGRPISPTAQRLL